MSRELSNDTEKALEQIAAGWGRKPTHAHPDCTCLVKQDRTEIEWFNGVTGVRARPKPWRRPACPIHETGRW